MTENYKFPSDQKLIETVGLTIYIGYSQSGTATSQAKWTIKRIVDNGSGLLSIKWADGNQSPDNVWDNRASLSYS